LAYLKEDRQQEAAEALQTATALAPHFAAGYSNLAEVLGHIPGKQHEYYRVMGAAELILRTRLQADTGKPGELQGMIGLARNLLHQLMNFAANPGNAAPNKAFAAKAAAATKLFQKAVKMSPKRGDLHNYLGISTQYDDKLHPGGGRREGREAETHFLRALELDPTLSDAHVKLGGLRKQQGDVGAAIEHYRLAISLGQRSRDVVQDLGLELVRLGKREEAKVVYQQAVTDGLWRSPKQRPIQTFDWGLEGKPIWPAGSFDFVKQLESQWETIREEFRAIQELAVPNEVQFFVKGGEWTEFGLNRMGVRNRTNCKLAPVTCRLVESIPAAVGSWRGFPIQGEAEFLLLAPGTRLEPHCGTTNRRLTMHLGLVTPPGPALRIGEELLEWKAGKAFVFDDSFEHEVWHNGTELRAVLYLSIWHPQLWPEMKAPPGLSQPIYAPYQNANKEL